MQTRIGGRSVRTGGIAKGSGMIHPNMATMLGVITTDAAVAPALWRGILQHGVAKSFNQVSTSCTHAAWHFDQFQIFLRQICSARRGAVAEGQQYSKYGVDLLLLA